MRFRSADRMLEIYTELYGELTSPRSIKLPDPTAASTFHLPSHPGDSRQHRALAELGDITRCLRAAQLDRREVFLLRQLYRPRRRYCRRCRRTFDIADRPRCPRCNGTRRDGWSFEPYPTLEVLAEHLVRLTKERWSYERVRRLRNRVLMRLEHVMGQRGMLLDDEPPTATLRKA